jgi:hypothetical protein
MKTVAVAAVLIWVAIAPAQVHDKSLKFAKNALSPKQRLWCPVLEYAIGGSKSSEPAMRAYLLDMAGLGIGKCDPAKISPTLVDSFTATLLIPEQEDEFNRPATPDEAWVESSRLESKRVLQQSALDHLAAVDERLAESILGKAEPSVRAGVLQTIASRAVTAKKYSRALVLLSQMPSTGFPYEVATDLMLALPSSRDNEKQEVFRLAMNADREHHSFVLGSDDFASMIVRFWKHLPPSVALQAIHQVLDAAWAVDERGVTLTATSGQVGFASEFDYRVFELLPTLKQLDASEADKLLNRSQQARSQLKQFPNGIQSLNPEIGDMPPKDGRPDQIGGSVGPASVANQNVQEEAIRNMYESRIKEIVRMAEDTPKQAIATAETLTNSDNAIGFESKNPRADALLAVAKAVMKKNPAAATDALQRMGEALKSGEHPYGATQDWTEGIRIANQIGEDYLALALFHSGMDQADQLASQDADSDDPNLALKAWWPSTSAAWQLVRTASEISTSAALERVRETKDLEILLVLEIGLANKELGAHVEQSITSVQKRRSKKSWSQYQRLDKE